MSIYIPDMEPPKPDEVIHIYNNREARKCPLFEQKVIEVSVAIPVPPHGRLICDRDVKWAFDDAILDEAQKTGRVRATSDEIASVINAIPTIIPASGGKENE